MRLPDLVFSITLRKYTEEVISSHYVHYPTTFFPLHFHQAKAKEEKLEKCGEDDETIPSEYRLKPATVNF